MVGQSEREELLVDLVKRELLDSCLAGTREFLNSASQWSCLPGYHPCSRRSDLPVMLVSSRSELVRFAHCSFCVSIRAECVCC